MTMHVRDSGVWKTASPQVKDGGVWKPHAGYVKDGGVWKAYHLSVSYAMSQNATAIYERPTLQNYVTFTITTTGLSDGAQVTFKVIGGNNFGTSDYNTTTGTKPSGNLTITNNQAILSVSVVAEQGDPGLSEGTETFYVTIHPGANGESLPAVLQSATVAVFNENCWWGAVGFPQFC